MSSFGSPTKLATGESTSVAASDGDSPSLQTSLSASQTASSPALQASVSASQTTSSSLSSSSSSSSSSQSSLTLSLGSSPQSSRTRPSVSSDDVPEKSSPTSGSSKAPSTGSSLLHLNSVSSSSESGTTPSLSGAPLTVTKRSLGSSYTISHSGSRIKFTKKPALRSSTPSSSSTQGGARSTKPSLTTSSASAFGPYDPSSSSTQEHDVPTNQLSSNTSSGSSFGSLRTLSHGSTFSSNSGSGPSSEFSFRGPVPQPSRAPASSFCLPSFFTQSSQASTSTSVTGTSLYDFLAGSQASSIGGQRDESSTANMDENGSRQSADESFVSISASSSFRNTSHEELRWIDYQMRNLDKLRNRSRQDPPTSSPPESCTFGSTNSSSQNSSSAFGSVQSSAIPTPSGDGSNTIQVSVPASGFAHVSFTGLPFVICLNNNGQGSGQTMPCVITFSQSTSATLTINCPHRQEADHSRDGSNGSGRGT